MCASAGYELVEIHYVREQGGWIVRVFIDSFLEAGVAAEVLAGAEQIDGRSSVTFNDCERVSRELSALLDVEDIVPHGYSLEVSSPGVARPLRTSAHFRRFKGECAKISLHEGISTDPGAGPRRNFTGTLLGVDSVFSSDAKAEDGEDTDNILIDVDGTQFTLPLADLASAKLVPDWEALAKQKPAAAKKADKSNKRGSDAHGVA